MSKGIVKIRIKMGDIELEYEGEELFLERDLAQLLKEIHSLHSMNKSSIELDAKSQSYDDDSKMGLEGLSVDAIAQTLSVKNGSDLIIAAAAYLTFIKGAEKFNRNELLDQMKTATPFYKKSYASNLSSYLNTLAKNDRLRLFGEGIFAISANERQSLSEKLAQHC